MSDAPETMWVFPRKDWFDAGASTHKILISGARDTEYRRADLPATNAQALANAKVQALVEALRDMLQHSGAYHPSGVKAVKALAAMKENPDE